MHAFEPRDEAGVIPLGRADVEGDQRTVVLEKERRGNGLSDEIAGQLKGIIGWEIDVVFLLIGSQSGRGIVGAGTNDNKFIFQFGVFRQIRQ